MIFSSDPLPSKMYDRILNWRTPVQRFFSLKECSFTITEFVSFQPCGQTPQSSQGSRARRVDENLLSSWDRAVPEEGLSDTRWLY